ncbi:MAG: valine--tRNA ligase [Candidatus Omnitrophica bacterium]|nr:valine--tRNA ligase [Candidatus Omnitrophota bacterium]
MSELSKQFKFQDVEDKWLEYWQKNNVFHGAANPQKKSFSVVIPPPNVTGILHMGHALNNTLQDILVRYKRMQGFETCWMAGTDHAGIATQNVVERELAKEKKTRHDIGREELLKRLWAWKDQYGDTIINQLKKIGASCDWPRTRFTMDQEYSQAVQEVFIRLHQKGLIYRGEYIINWCPRCQTALSDEEAEHQEHQGNLYHIRYPLQKPLNGREWIVVATTRPETMLGDTAVAVNPTDERYKDLIGQKLILPLMNREIPIIADDFVDPQFGTGMVKVTPAHDPNDFQMGRRHGLSFVNVMHPDGRMNDLAGEFSGMDRFEARENIIERLRESQQLEKVEAHVHSVGHCYRCHTVVEPYLSKQWFVRMKPLAEPALRVVQEGKIKFYPERWTKVYTNWMENIRDWCISRQIWWGHRIPAWYCAEGDAGREKCQEPIISKDRPVKCLQCGCTTFRQDDDVLDTWFSSWLWPFATFGWPEKTKDLEYFYPTKSLFTASEIIFFWVARMIMAGLEFMDDVPFSEVYIHGTVRDSKGRKMSKSLGNAIDPLEIINEYGADALRFSLIINSGQDLFISKEKFEIGRNFANKIWNASRLILLNVPEGNQIIDLKKDVDVRQLDLPSRWIISRFFTTLKNVEQAIEGYRFSEAETLIQDFFWGNFCDWYLEISKNKFTDSSVQKVALGILQQSVGMIHPFMPFVTEELWQHVGGKDQRCLASSSWPKSETSLINAVVEQDMQALMDVVAVGRNIKMNWNIKLQQEIECQFATEDERHVKLLEENMNMLKSLLRINTFSIANYFTKNQDSAVGVVGRIKFLIPLGNLIDVQKEKQRILQDIQEQKKHLTGLSARLENQDFVKKAPPDIVEKDQVRLKTLTIKIKELEEVVQNLG